MIIDGKSIGSGHRIPDDPVIMRMDFANDDSQKVVDLFLRFDQDNPWAEGLRIKVTKDLTAGPLGRVFTALGLMELKAQFMSVNDITEVPKVHMFTVSDDFGNGATLAEFQQVAIALELNSDLGNYLFNKDDVYFFEADMDWDWIQKSITDARYRRGRTTLADGGTWIPFDPSLEMIASELDLGTDYFTGTLCADLDDN